MSGVRIFLPPTVAAVGLWGLSSGGLGPGGYALWACHAFLHIVYACTPWDPEGRPETGTRANQTGVYYAPA